MLLEDMQVAHARFDKLRSDQLPAVVPLLAIRGEDGIAQEFRPVLMEFLSLAKIQKLSCENCLDIVRIDSEYEPLTCKLQLRGTR